MIRSKRKQKKPSKPSIPIDISNEPVNIHCCCNKCGKEIVLPEKVWLRRGAICNACHHRIYEED